MAVAALTGFSIALGLGTGSDSLGLVDLRGLQVLAHLLAVDEEEVLLADVLLEKAAWGKQDQKNWCEIVVRLEAQPNTLGIRSVRHYPGHCGGPPTVLCEPPRCDLGRLEPRLRPGRPSTVGRRSSSGVPHSSVTTVLGRDRAWDLQGRSSSEVHVRTAIAGEGEGLSLPGTPRR